MAMITPRFLDFEINEEEKLFKVKLHFTDEYKHNLFFSVPWKPTSHSQSCMLNFTRKLQEREWYKQIICNEDLLDFFIEEPCIIVFNCVREEELEIWKNTDISNPRDSMDAFDYITEIYFDQKESLMKFRLTWL